MCVLVAATPDALGPQQPLAPRRNPIAKLQSIAHCIFASKLAK
jgi:hypothetical protein